MSQSGRHEFLVAHYWGTCLCVIAEEGEHCRLQQRACWCTPLQAISAHQPCGTPNAASQHAGPLCRELSFLEQHLESTIAAKVERERREVQAAQDSPWIAGQTPRRPLPRPAEVAAPGFTADALRAHPFFRECEAAVASRDADLLLPAPAGAVQPISDDASTPAAVHWALMGLQSSASALAHHISTEV